MVIGARGARPAALAAIALVGGIVAAAPLAAEDLLIRRDGGRSTGQLRACVGENCYWNGSPVPRSEIAWIALGAADGGPPPAPGNPRVDAVWSKQDGREISAAIVGISLGAVATEAESFERAEVGWVYFGSMEGMPRQEPGSSPGDLPSAAPPATLPAAPAMPAVAASESTKPESRESSSASESPTQPAPTAPALLLNEVLFLPQENQVPFVEIRNAGTASVSLDGVTLRNEKGKSFALPKTGALAPGALVVVRFDGAKGAEKGVVHAPAGDFLGRAAGALWLASRDGAADGVAWGLHQPRAVELCRGGRCAEAVPGSVIARSPDVATALTPAAWAPLDPEHATPGQPNPRAPVSIFAALPGTIFAGQPRFSWYSVAGAARYRLEVAREESFGALVHEAAVSGAPGVRLEQLTALGPELAPGRYFWRVQALGAGGDAAAYSSPVPFEVRSRRPAQHSSRVFPGGLDSSKARALGGGADDPPSAPPAPAATRGIEVCPGLTAGEGFCKELAVPVIKHQKDTEMLTLEAPNKEPPMGWDKPDTAGYPYCARAGVAMVNAYYRAKLNVSGKLSQDRIGYEVFKHLPDFGGPEYDLPVVGITNHSTDTYSLPLALGTNGNYHSSPSPFNQESGPCRQRNQALGCGRTSACPPCPVELSYRWGYEALQNIKAEIDADRPLIVTGPGHLYLIVGYVEKGEEFSIIEQDGGGRNLVSLQQNQGEEADWVDGQNVITQLDGNEAVSLQLLIDAYWTGLTPVKLASDEQSITDDFDDDGVVDFDEQERFDTKLREPDSDGDGIDDKEEIHYSVWDPDHGYHQTVATFSPTASQEEVAARAQNALREVMELTKDSDNGGCEDGEEDLNANGIRDPNETSNFVRGDDPVSEDGGCATLWTGTAEMRLGTRKPLERRDIHITAELRLREIDFQPLADPGPAYGGRDLGARVGSLVQLQCLSMTLHEAWRDELKSERNSRGEVMVQVMTAEGSKTIDTFSPTAGFIWRKSGDLDLTAILGFDIPRGGGLYAVTGCDFEFRKDLETVYTCSGSRSCYEPSSQYMPFTGPFGIGRAPLEQPVTCADPEIRYLEAGGQMTGSYTYREADGVCVTTHGTVTWSLCKAGTACSALPPPPAAPP